MTETLEYDIIKKTNNITKITETGSIALHNISRLDVSKTKEYEYNVIGNLTKETINGQDTYEYEYDTWGNLTKVTKNNQTQKEFTYNHDRLLTYKINTQHLNTFKMIYLMMITILLIITHSDIVDIIMM